MNVYDSIDSKFKSEQCHFRDGSNISNQRRHYRNPWTELTDCDNPEKDGSWRRLYGCVPGLNMVELVWEKSF